MKNFKFTWNSIDYSLVGGHISKRQEVVPDRAQRGKDLRERRDDEVLAMAARSNEGRINSLLLFADVSSVIQRGENQWANI